MDGLSRILALASIPLLIITLFLTYKFLTIANLKTNEQFQDQKLPRITQDDEEVKIYPETDESSDSNADQMIYDFVNNEKIDYDPEAGKAQIDPYTSIPDKNEYLEAAANIKHKHEEEVIEEEKSHTENLPIITIEKTDLTTKDNSQTEKPGHMVQIGAFSNKKNAITKWDQLVKKYPTIFEETPYKINQVENNKGKLYKLNAGPFKAENIARKFCKQLRTNNISCFYTFN